MPAPVAVAENVTLFWGATGPTLTSCDPMTLPDLSTNSTLNEKLRCAAVLFVIVPPSVVFASVGVNSVNATRAGSFCIASLYLTAESTSFALESWYALMTGVIFAAESMFAFWTAADARGAFARWPYAFALLSASFAFDA